MSFIYIVISMFLIMNSVGHLSGYLDLVKAVPRGKRQQIIVREMFFALIIMLFFHYVGEFLLDVLEVKAQTILLSGGVILFLIAIRMIFPQNQPTSPLEKEEPFIFPIATPMIAGPSILTTIMLYAHQEPEGPPVVLAIIIAWALSIIILYFAEEIRQLVGRRTLIAIERLMGLLLTMIAVEMVLNGIDDIIKNGIV